MIVEAIKLSLENMNKKFTDLSKLKFDEINQTLEKTLKEQKIQERPFAYEFYHQFRKLWDNGSISRNFSENIVVQAEINKRYQEIPNLNRIPDFLLHVPSSNKNFAVIEFKLASNFREIKKDFKKLIGFKHRLNYKYLIEVIIGDEISLKNAEERINQVDMSEGEEIIIIEFDTKSWKAKDFEIKYLP